MRYVDAFRGSMLSAKAKRPIPENHIAPFSARSEKRINQRTGLTVLMSGITLGIVPNVDF